MNSFGAEIATILAGITGVAILAVLVSKNSQTASVIQSAASGFSNALGVAVSPISGTAPSLNLAYPSSGLNGIGSANW